VAASRLCQIKPAWTRRTVQLVWDKDAIITSFHQIDKAAITVTLETMKIVKRHKQMNPKSSLARTMFPEILVLRSDTIAIR
jgi:hypothetical protein